VKSAIFPDPKQKYSKVSDHSRREKYSGVGSPSRREKSIVKSAVFLDASKVVGPSRPKIKVQ
jgi:hypothetical protein